MNTISCSRFHIQKRSNANLIIIFPVGSRIFRYQDYLHVAWYVVSVRCRRVVPAYIFFATPSDSRLWRGLPLWPTTPTYHPTFSQVAFSYCHQSTLNLGMLAEKAKLPVNVFGGRISLVKIKKGRGKSRSLHSREWLMCAVTLEKCFVHTCIVTLSDLDGGWGQRSPYLHTDTWEWECA